MWTLLALCCVVFSHTVQGDERWWTTESPSCLYNCGYNMGSCSCSSSCQYRGNCCPDYHNYCWSTTDYPTTETTESPSCRYNCGYDMGSCSCSSSCQYRGNCCPDYHNYCWSTTDYPTTETTESPSCRNLCGYDMGSCSCSSSCQYRGNCCPDYHNYCWSTTDYPPIETTESPSCRYNCGNYMGSCSCSSSCQYRGNCCPDYHNYCWSTTDYPVTETTESPSCRNLCGYDMGSCSCSSSCQYRGNCCPDYHNYCWSTTDYPPIETTESPSCRNLCGYDMGSCSCSSSCQYRGNCCPDYHNYCWSTTDYPVTETTESPSCRYNCGNYMGSCSCSSSCQYRGNCCPDYHNYCWSTTDYPVTDTTESPSCRYNCGNYMGSCSCSSSCQYRGNCCPDYHNYCWSTTDYPVTETTESPSCRYHCGYDMGSCSCSSSCQYRGNCCPDYYNYCLATTESTTIESTSDIMPEEPCGGSIFGIGNFSSPNHPNHYYDNADCVWYLRAVSNQRVFLTFSYIQLENCCHCDYISVYDGPSLNSKFLGKVCENNQITTFHSSSNYMTVRFRTDGSVVGRGFKANFLSSLPSSSGQVSCSSENMTIVIQRSYLESLGFDGHSLYLNNQNCRPQVTSHQVIFTYPVESCGNIRKVDNGTDVYSNSLRAYTAGEGEITRQAHFKLNVICSMQQESVSQIMYLVSHHENSTLLGSGTYNTSMEFYTSRSYQYKVTQFPYQVTLNQDLYIQLNLKNSRGRMMFLDTCIASPSPTDFQSRFYYLRNGCSMESTFQVYQGGSSYRFGFKAFQFLRAGESVYIRCKVLVCQISDQNSRCRRGCIRRSTRDLKSEHESQTLVLGPIQLQDPEEKEEGTPEQEKE